MSGDRLNIGCGAWPLLHWINLDADPQVRADIHAQTPPIPFPDNHLAEIYAGHLLEHLPRARADVFLAECYRVLAPGGLAGIVVPDTREIMGRWLAGTVDEVQFPEGTWWPMHDLEAVCHLFVYSDVQDSPHQWCWDLPTLARAMQRAGFVALTEINRFHDPRIPVGAWYQCGLAGRKP